MQKGIYLTVLIRLNAPTLSFADRDSLLAGFQAMLESKLGQGTQAAGLKGEIKRAKFQSDTDGQRTRLIVRLTGEQEPATSFAPLAITELQSLLDALLNTGGVPLQVELIEENTNALEEIDSDESYSIN